MPNQKRHRDIVCLRCHKKGPGCRYSQTCHPCRAKLGLPNVAPVNYLEFLLNNRKKRVQSFEVISSTGQNVFAALNAVSQILLHKFSKQNEVPDKVAPPVAIPVGPTPNQGAQV